MAAEMKAIRDAVQGGEPRAIEMALRTAFASDATAALRYIREKELFFLSRVPATREHFRNALIGVITACDREGNLLRSILPYLAYCDIVADLRDQLSARADNEAQVLATFAPEVYIELCVIAVASVARQYVKKTFDAAPTTSRDQVRSSGVPALLVAAVWGVADIYALLPLMLAEVAAAARTNRTRAPLSLLDAERAAQRLCNVAADWKRHTDIRQRVAWNRDSVTRVEPGYSIFVSPNDITYEWLYLATRRRHALIGMRRTDENAPEMMREVLMPFIEPVARFVCANSAENSVEELANAALVELSSSMLPSDNILFDVFLILDEVGSLARALFAAYMLRYLYGYTATELRRGKRSCLPRWNIDEIVGLLVAVGNTTSKIAREAISLIAWDPRHGSKAGFELLTTPFVKLDAKRIGMVLLPGVNIAPATETRRTLASTNRISRAVGESYERYVRRLLADAGFLVLPHAVTLSSEGKAVTDVDALAYKDGLVVVCQAKHVIEPDSHHARWKAQHEITNGVRQCLVARNFLRDSELLFSFFPEARQHLPIEIFCLVVTPALDFGGEVFWPVAVVDDAYLQHVVHIGQTRTFDGESGDLVGAEPLYEGMTPTGQEFRGLMMFPEVFRYYRGENGRLTAVETRIRHVRFTTYEPSDSHS